jgi:hypothetical protein
MASPSDKILPKWTELVPEADELLGPKLGLKLASESPGRDPHGGVDPVPVQ